MTVVVHTTPPLDGLPASDGESLRLLGTLKLGGVQADTRTAGWGANGEFGSVISQSWVRRGYSFRFRYAQLALSCGFL